MGLLDRYRQFEALDEEEVNRGLRARAKARREQALARTEPLDLQATTWPEFPPHSVVNAITFAARRGLHSYLDPHAGELRAELSHLLGGIAPERIVVGDGAGQLLASAATALMADGDELVTPWPGYPLHPIVARAARGSAVPVEGFSADALLSAVTPRTRIVLLANPNDPTGELLRTGELRRLLDALPERVVVVLDEALRDYVDVEDRDAALALQEDSPRLLVVRSFSKAWGLAGLRCGFAVASAQADALLDRIRPPLAAAELSLAGALDVVRHHPALAARRAALIAEHRRALLGALGERPRLLVTPSQANVLWLAADGLPGPELGARLERSGVLVRSGAPLGDADRVRLTVPHRPEAVDRVVAALDAALRD